MSSFHLKAAIFLLAFHKLVNDYKYFCSSGNPTIGALSNQFYITAITLVLSFFPDDIKDIDVECKYTEREKNLFLRVNAGKQGFLITHEPFLALPIFLSLISLETDG